MSASEDPRRLSQPSSLQSGTTEDASKSPSTQEVAAGEAPQAPALSVEERRRIRIERRHQIRAARTQARIAEAARDGAQSQLMELADPVGRQRPQSRAESVPAFGLENRGAEPRRVLELKSLPQQGRKRSFGTLLSFIVCVLLPIAAASVYYYQYASDQYASEFKFVVRDAKSAAAASSGASASLQLGMFSAGGTNSVENYMVTEYLLSGDAVEALQKEVDLLKMYSQPEIDWLSRLDPSAPLERIVPYWRRMTTITYDQVTGLGIAKVRAFSPEDAYKIAVTLVRLAEHLVNDVANRPQRDAIRFAEADLKRAEDRLNRSRADLAKYRDAELLIEPQADAVTGKIALAQTLRAAVSSLQTELSVLKGQNLGPTAAQVVALERRLRATLDQLRAVESQVATAKDGSTPLSKVVGEFERLDAERQFAQTLVSNAMQNLESTRSNALVQHVYVTAFVAPLLPQSSTYPKRITSIILVGLGCMLFWTIGLLIIGSVREHLT